MRALILAAGRGRRLGVSCPKCLLEFGGKALIERHLESLHGIPTTVVVGFEQDQVRSRLGDRVTYIENPRYGEGSIRSLEAGLVGLDDDLLIMDSDVLCHPQVLVRLVGCAEPFAFAVDRRSRPGGEEMMVSVKDGWVVEIARRPSLPCDWMGETVGFTLLSRKLLRDLCVAVVAVDDGDYELALNRVVQVSRAAAVPVDDLPWTEIDVPEDLENAKSLLPRLT